MAHRPIDKHDPAGPTPLYEQLRDRLFAKILDGTWPDDSFLPTEADLCKSFRMSRVTVRRALQALKNDGVIAAVAGQGTRVTYRNNGHAGEMQLIVLVADFESEFFNNFLHRFEAIAEARGSVVMLKTDRSGATFTADTLFQKLARGGIRDMVLWPLQSDLDPNLYARLRAVGVNLVVFDQQLDVPWADVVCLDNRAAMDDLLSALQQDGCRRPALVSYSNQRTPAVAARIAGYEQACRARKLAGSFHEILYHPDQRELDRQIDLLIARHADLPSGERPDGYLGVNGGMGQALAHVLRGSAAARLRKLPLGMVDVIAELRGQRVHAIDQPMQGLAAAVFDSLLRQHRLAAKWSARQVLLPGKLLLL